MKILVCIASHNPANRMKYINRILSVYSEYKEDVFIYMDVNEYVDIPGVAMFIHSDLQHPYHLTWLHRRHVQEEIDDFDYFIYQEDDMEIPYANFLQYVDNFNLLWPHYVPSFVRIEIHNGIKYNTDNTSVQKLYPVIVGGKEFASLGNPYHAFWMMPQKELKETLTKNFVRLDTWREMAASYPMWDLQKKPLVMLENKKVSPLCYSYHLPGNYASDKNTYFGKIEIDKLLAEN